MKAIGIVGYKKSGKTTLGVRLAKDLVRGSATVDQCVSHPVSLQINGKDRPLDGDTAQQIRSSISRWLPSIEGHAKTIQIDLSDEKA